jgi:hypothetical protein
MRAALDALAGLGSESKIKAMPSERTSQQLPKAPDGD